MYINPSFRPYDTHLNHLSFGECERILGVRAYLSFCEERGFSFEFSSFSSEKIFLSLKTQTFDSFSFFFSTQSITFQTFQTFHSSNSHEMNLRTLDYIYTFSYENHEEHLIFDRNMFLHDPTWKYQLVDSCSKFQFLIEISPSTHEIGYSFHMSSLWV